VGDFKGLSFAGNCSGLRLIAPETTVNRLVAGPNPARGAKLNQRLRGFLPSLPKRQNPHLATVLATILQISPG
jgi:hypothetical protein